VAIREKNENMRKKKRRKIMAANVESMFYVRETPWHGLGTRVMEAPDSRDALIVAGLNWNVVQEPIYTETEELIDGYKANIRDSDRSVLGVVTDRYKVIQNNEAFAFTDALLGEGVRYETAGSLQGGKKVWLLAHMPHEYIISGEHISPYLLFSNTHDGSGAIKVALTPIRVVCNNTLNLALSTAKRSWSMIHTGDIKEKIQEAQDTLFMAEKYMDSLGKEFENLRMKKITDKQVMDYIEVLLPMEDSTTPQQAKNIRRLREDLKMRYFDAPDLQDVGKNAYRFVNAVSDFATHAEPLRKTVNYKENLFARTVEGNPLIDKAYQLMCA
jgi:phage/plasmid-like protein (TIGR03299 family)